MKSIWSETCDIPQGKPLRGDTETEIAVIGAGMAGILIASALQRAGRQVAVFEAKRIASGQTRNTTAKITAQHGLFAERLIKTLGEERAKKYAAANLAAIEAYRKLIAEENIDCDFSNESAFVYGDDEILLENEAKAQAALGLATYLVSNPDVPGGAKAAVRADGQAQFHPLKFLKAISEPLTIYENTPVISVDGGELQTARGRVRAEKVVFACHYPFINFPGMYFARMHQERSYVLALENASIPGGMWIGAGDGGYSFRKYGDLVLFGGEGHRTGENSGGGKYEALRKRASGFFQNSRVKTYWSAQDCVTADGVPYIGRYSDSTPNWYVATGFQKWGMTTSMASAMILRDMICGRENPYADAFDPGRFDLKAVAGTFSEGAQAVKGLTRSLLNIPQAYKDESGEVHAVSVKCPHLGCQLTWNPDEKTWDCPCHGSRFTANGELISGPAQEDLEFGE
ncbi:MAG: FAD-dependent oxidoreductase [Oscillospiraceae bacterium]|nr:FAD-dependent oxidoreductase [Oscillospiraceae bacterium]